MKVSEQGRPIIDSETTLVELQNRGATTLSDIPLNELLVYVRNTCFSVAKDMIDDEDEASNHFGDAGNHIQAALESLNKAGLG